MAVKLRLTRMGKRNRPYYRLCVVDSRSPRDGEYIENVGVYDPHIADEHNKVRIKRERVEHWLSVGAEPTETVFSFLRKAQVSGLIRPKKTPRKRHKSTKSSPEKAQAAKKKREKRRKRRRAKQEPKAQQGS